MNLSNAQHTALAHAAKRNTIDNTIDPRTRTSISAATIRALAKRGLVHIDRETRSEIRTAGSYPTGRYDVYIEATITEAGRALIA